MPDPVHPAVRGFDRTAAAYERGRPSIPPEAADRLTQVLGLSTGRTVLELGAGTGKFTRVLERTGVRVLALEPSEGMRAELLRQSPDVPLVGGTAEAIDLPAASVDAVVAAQAFHWFDVPRAAREAARVLRPHGGLGLLWNIRDESVPWVRTLSKILDARDPGVPRGREHTWRGPLEATGLFTPVESAQFHHVQRMDRRTMEDRVRSISFIAMLPAAEQEAVVREVFELLDRDPLTRGRPRVELPYRTDVFWAYRR